MDRPGGHVSLAATVLALVLGLLTGCSSDDEAPESSASAGGADPAPPSPAGTGVAFPVPRPGPKAADQVSDELSDVAAAGRTVVAVGDIDSPAVTQPVIVVSRDGGRHWEPASLEATGSTTEEDVWSVAHGPRGWIALGSDANGVPVAWTSRDGGTWTRQGSAGFTRADEVEDVTVSDAGFLGVGQTSRGDQALPVAWFSRDGKSWTRRVLPGPRKDRGAAAFAVAAVGLRVAAVGLTSDGESREPRSWFSRDGGRTWRGERIVGEVLVDVAGRRGWGRFRGTVFFAVGKDGGIPPPGTRSIPNSGWEPDGKFRLEANTDVRGGPWVGDQITPRLLPGDQELYAVAPLAERFVVGGLDRRGGVDAFVWRDTPDGWRPVTGGGLRGPGEQSIAAATPVGRSAVLVGVDGRSGNPSAAAWIVDPGGQVTQIRGPRLLKVPPPQPNVDDIGSDGERLVATGSVAGRATAWTSTDGQRWTRIPLPGSGPSTQAELVTPGPRGWLIVGERHRLRSSSLLAWRSKDGRHWRQIGDVTRPVAYDYHDADDLAHTARGYVVVGQSGHGEFSNGSAWWSFDGRFWSSTASAREADDRRSKARNGPSGSLFGTARRDVAVLDVAPAPHGIVAGGFAREGDLGRPVVWVSPDRQVWRRSRLPMPSPCRAAAVTQVGVADGGGVVAAGSCWTGPGAEERPVFWHRIGGEWKADDPGPAGDIAELLRLTDRWLAVGSQGEGDQDDAAVWTSTDGRSWEPVELDESFGGAGRQSLASPVVLQGRLLALFSSRTPDGSYTLAMREIPSGSS